MLFPDFLEQYSIIVSKMKYQVEQKTNVLYAHETEKVLHFCKKSVKKQYKTFYRYRLIHQIIIYTCRNNDRIVT